MIIQIDPEIVKHFDCLYGKFQPEDVQKAIEHDINLILRMHFDNRILGDPIQIDNVGWMRSSKIISA